MQESNLSKISSSFDNKFEQIGVNCRIEATKFEPEATFKNNIDDVKVYHVKSMTSLDINISAITSNKPSLFSEHLNANLMIWIVLQSPGTSL